MIVIAIEDFKLPTKIKTFLKERVQSNFGYIFRKAT